MIIFDLEHEVYDLTDDESSNITGGGIGALGGATGSILDNVFNGEEINWRSAGAWAIGGGIGGAAAGGLVGAALAGED